MLWVRIYISIASPNAQPRALMNQMHIIYAFFAKNPLRLHQYSSRVQCVSATFFYKATFTEKVQIQEGQNSPPKKETRRNPVLKSRLGLLLDCFNCLHGVVIKYCVVMVAQNLDLHPQHCWLTLFCVGRIVADA